MPANHDLHLKAAAAHDAAAQAAREAADWHTQMVADFAFYDPYTVSAGECDRLSRQAEYDTYAAAQFSSEALDDLLHEIRKGRANSKFACVSIFHRAAALTHRFYATKTGSEQCA